MEIANQLSINDEQFQRELGFLSANRSSYLPARWVKLMTKGTIKDIRLWLARLAGRTLPTSQVGEFVDRLIHDKMYYRGPERRRCPRYPLAVSVSAIPLDNHLQPAGSPFDALTRDISASGLSMISDTRSEAKYFSLLLVNSPSDYLDVVIRVVRFRVVGPMYEYAGPFITVAPRLKEENTMQAPRHEPLAV